MMGEDVKEKFQAKWGELEGKVLHIIEGEHDNERVQLLLNSHDTKQEMSSGTVSLQSNTIKQWY